MRQLTSLDAQFLALENDRTHGHVGSLAVYDPATAPGGVVTVGGLRRMLRERLHLLTPFRWRLARCPSVSITRSGSTIPISTSSTTFASWPCPRLVTIISSPSRSRGSTHGRLDRARPLWEMYVIQGLHGGRSRCSRSSTTQRSTGSQAPRCWACCSTRPPRGATIRPASAEPPPAPAPDPLEMLARGLAGIPRHQLRTWRALPRTLAHLDALPGVGAIPAATTSRA